MRVDIDLRQVKKIERGLNMYTDVALPIATQRTVNTLAFDARNQWQSEIQSNMIQRNKFTKQSIRVEKAVGLNLETMHSKVGSIAPYMDEQEEGETKVAKGKYGVPLATTYASGEGEGAGVRRRLPRRSNQLASITLRNKALRAKSKAQRNAIAVKQAILNKDKYVYIDTGRRKFIARVIRKGRRGADIKMLHDLSHKTVKIPRNPTMKPAVQRTQAKAPAIYVKNLEFQVRRNKLFVR